MSNSASAHLARGLRAGIADIQHHVVLQFYDRLVALVRKRIPTRARRIGDEEDIALCALGTLFVRMEKGDFTDIETEDDIWRLLIGIAKFKIAKHIEREMAQKRGSGMTRGDSVWSDDSDNSGFDNVAVEMDPQTHVEVVEYVQAILQFIDELNDPTLKSIAIWISRDKTHDWIAEQLGCSVKTVQRKLKLLKGKVQSWAG